MLLFSLASLLQESRKSFGWNYHHKGNCVREMSGSGLKVIRANRCAAYYSVLCYSTWCPIPWKGGYDTFYSLVWFSLFSSQWRSHGTRDREFHFRDLKDLVSAAELLWYKLQRAKERWANGKRREKKKLPAPVVGSNEWRSNPHQRKSPNVGKNEETTSFL